MDGAMVVLFYQTVDTLQKRSVTYTHLFHLCLISLQDMITALHDFTFLADLNDILASVLPSIHTV